MPNGKPDPVRAAQRSLHHQLLRSGVLIVAKLRQVDVLVSQGQNMADAIHQIGASELPWALRTRMHETR